MRDGYKASIHPAFLWDRPRIFLFVIDPNTGKAKHVAVTVGGGYEVEARSHAYGVVMRKIKDCAFTHWKRLPGLDDEVGAVCDPAQAPVEDSLVVLRTVARVSMWHRLKPY
jgi:hypothetical protein